MVRYAKSEKITSLKVNDKPCYLLHCGANDKHTNGSLNSINLEQSTVTFAQNKIELVSVATIKLIQMIKHVHCSCDG